jgi:hypothetical protein
VEKLFTHFNISQFLFLNDLLLGPIYIYLILYFSNKYAVRKGGIYERFFVKAVAVRIVGSVLTALMYQYYYHGGDTFVYFLYTLTNKRMFTENFAVFFDAVFKFDHDKFLLEYYLGGDIPFYFDPSTDIVIKISTLLSFPFLNTFILISITFSLFAFYGCWKLFRMFHEMYPYLEKEMAIACLFIPSVFFWGTGITKDALCIGALGMFTFAVYDLLIKGRNILSNIFLILLGAYLLYAIKVYIILAFAPALVVWVFLKHRSSVKNKYIRFALGPIIFIGAPLVGVIILTQIASVAEQYSFEAMERTAKDTQNWLVYSTQMQGGSFYTLGDIDYSLVGMVKVFPKAVNVALFRPYIWEARKPMLVPAALEAVVSLYLTIRLLLRAGVFRVIKMIIANPEVQFCLIYSIVFAFCIGFTSFNFGALARYKIPLMPFYYIALFILGDTQKKSQDQLDKNVQNP